MIGTVWRGTVGVLLLGLTLAPPARAQAPTPAEDASHVGIASCASENCHGAVKPLPNVQILQSEYLIWKSQDKHRNAYAVLLTEPAKRIAANLNLPEPAEKSSLCLDCHADNVPKERQGPQFTLADGVGCEACHGGASTWLGVHLSGMGHQANVAAGLYPLDDAQKRGERCLSCHVGDDTKFVTHKIMGAGHPPMPFELDTFSAIQPAHFQVTPDYAARMGHPYNDVQIWAIGQAVDVKQRMALILSDKRQPHGVNFELSLFDCQSCHHSMTQLQWRKRSSTGLDPGRIKLYDATTVMLRVIANRVAPDKAEALKTHLLALHAATGGEWKTVKSEAQAVQEAATALIAAFKSHDFNRADANALADAVIASATDDAGDLDYSGAQQQVDALRSIVAGAHQRGDIDEQKFTAFGEAIAKLMDAVANDQTYDPGAYKKLLEGFKARLPL